MPVKISADTLHPLSVTSGFEIYRTIIKSSALDNQYLLFDTGGCTRGVKGYTVPRGGWQAVKWDNRHKILHRPQIKKVSTDGF